MLSKEELLRLYDRSKLIDKELNPSRRHWMKFFNTDAFLAACDITQLNWIKEDLGERIEAARLSHQA